MRALIPCFYNGNNLQSALKQVLEAAIELTGADFGNIRLWQSATGTLKIATHRGFTSEFLEYFDRVHDGEAACGTALKTRQRVLVEDVACHPIFKNPRTIEVLLATGVRGVQSTPLFGREGTFQGMLSTHYRTPRLPSQYQLQALDVIARVAGNLIEWKLAPHLHHLPIDEAPLQSAAALIDADFDCMMQTAADSYAKALWIREKTWDELRELRIRMAKINKTSICNRS